MFFALIFVLSLSCAYAVPLASYGGYGAGIDLGGYGSGLGLAGYGSGLGLIGTGVSSHGVLPAAVHSRRTYQIIPVPSHHEPAQLSTIEVPPIENPVLIKYVSKSSPVVVEQLHIQGEPGRHEATHSEDQPHRLSHTVVRPVIQEVREVIVPYRKIQQEILPVQEEVQTLVAKGEKKELLVAHEAPLLAHAPLNDISGGITGSLSTSITRHSY